MSWLYVIYHRRFVFEYNGKCIFIFKEVKPILLEPGRFKVPCSAHNKKHFQMRFLKILNFRLCALFSVLINISFVTLLTLFSGSKNRRSSVCLLSFCLSDVPVSFIFANLTKMFGNQADLEGDYHLTWSVFCKGFSWAQVELNCFRKLSSPIFVHLQH